MDLKFQVQTKIQKPLEEVFEAVHKPEKLSGYFTNGGASGPLHEGSTVEWRFADNPGEEPITVPVSTPPTSVICSSLFTGACASNPTFRETVWACTSSKGSCKRRKAASHSPPLLAAAPGLFFIFRQHNESRPDTSGRGRDEPPPHIDGPFEERRLSG